MNTLGYAILGLISKEKMTGYDLSKVFNSTVADFWNANQSQIYPELKKLVQDELIQYEVIVQGEFLEKKVYSITKKGKSTLLKWLSEEEPPIPQSKDIFKLRIYFAEHLDKENLLQKLETRRQMCENLLERYQVKSLEYQNLEHIASTQLGDFLLLKGAIIQLKAQLSWLDESIHYIQSSQ